MDLNQLLYLLLYFFGAVALVFFGFWAAGAVVGQVGQSGANASALSIAKSRLDRGEIDQAEYEEICRTLRG